MLRPEVVDSVVDVGRALSIATSSAADPATTNMFQQSAVAVDSSVMLAL
jgi:hypothetical protein